MKQQKGSTEMRGINVCLLVTGLLVGRANAEVVIDGVDLGAPVATPASVVAPKTPPAAPRLTAPQADDRLDFINGDRLHGRLSAASGSTGRLTWKHGAAAEDILFETASLAQIQLALRSTSTSAAYDAVVHLTNGDSLPGRIVAMDAEILEIDTWYSGSVKINRRMVMNILPNLSMSNVLFEGPNELAEWTLYPHGGNRPQWRYSEGALYSIQRYPAGRIIAGLPEKYEVRFDAAWRGQYPQFSFIFSTADVQQSSDAYMLNVQASSISMTRTTRNTGGNNIGTQINYSGFDGNSGKRSASFAVLVDKAARSFTLLIDGSMAGQWTDPGEFAGNGNGIAFRSGSGSDLKISRIKVAHWDGRVPGAVGSSETASKEDQVRFVNNDKFSGRIVSIADGVVKFETSYATLDVPVNRVMEIVMASDGAERARRNRDDVRAAFVEKGILTLNLDRIEDDVLHGQSENFGKISVSLGVIKALELNIYRTKPSGDSDDF
jgi:hypothetical protein